MTDFCSLLVEHLELTGYSFVLLALISIFAWKFGYFWLPPAEHERKNAIYFWDVLGIFGIFFLTELFITPLISISWLSYKQGSWLKSDHPPIDPMTQSWLNLVAIGVAAFGVGLFYLSLRKRVKNIFWGHGFVKAIRNFSVGVITWLISYPYIIVISQIVAVMMMIKFPAPHAEQVAVQQLKSTFVDPTLFWITTFAVICVVPIIEETIFRGFLQTWLVSNIGRFWGIAIAAFVFAGFHFSTAQGNDNAELLISLFVLACFLGFIFERQKSLYAPIGLHMTFNAVSIFFISK
jgi:uncharacterized protein